MWKCIIYRLFNITWYVYVSLTVLELLQCHITLSCYVPMHCGIIHQRSYLSIYCLTKGSKQADACVKCPKSHVVLGIGWIELAHKHGFEGFNSCDLCVSLQNISVRGRSIALSCIHSTFHACVYCSIHYDIQDDERSTINCCHNECSN
jgi:hypothetical protein